MGEIFVRLKALPLGMNAVTILDCDGNYNVYLNDRLSYDAQRDAYEHELTHIERDDFYNQIPIEKAERI